MKIVKRLEPEKLHCDICDFFGFKARKIGFWSFCYWKNKHFPPEILPGNHCCSDFSFKGQTLSEIRVK